MKIVIRLVLLVVFLGGSSVVYKLMHPAAKSCESLVTTANGAIEVFNKSASITDPSIVSTFNDTSLKLRKDANDYKSPFDTDARTSATDLDTIVAAIGAKSESGVNAGIAKYNADVEKTNSDCKAAR